ncbi:MAG: LysM domain [Acidobacteriota bacterium]|jgi:LysM repeat protein|nr:LysM domain [Acidobacteriota bacterium]
MTYVVQWGDTPAGIAERLGVAWADVVRLNPALQINPRFIYAGQALNVPATRPRTVTPQEPAPLPPAVRPRTVTPPTNNTPPTNTKTLAQMLGLDKLTPQDKQLLERGALGLAVVLLLAVVKD